MTAKNVKLESILNEIKQVAVQTGLNHLKRNSDTGTQGPSYHRIEAMIGGFAMHRQKGIPMT